MIDRKDLLALNFYKGRPFTGSDSGIRYMIEKQTPEEEDDGNNQGNQKKEVLKAYIWPEPFCFEATPDERKGSRIFDFSEEGLCEAAAWLNEKHDSYREAK